MAKVFHFDSPRDVYVADTAVVWCFDDRVNLVLGKFLRRLGVQKADRIVVAGGAKCLAAPSDDPDRDFVLKQIRLSIALHQTRRIVLMLHSDCGACGGLAAFGGDTRLESEKQSEELRTAIATVREMFPELQVEGYFVDFEGVWAVDGRE
jgi:carbonic anhydrase